MGAPKDDPALSKDDPKRTLQFVDHLGGELFVGLLGGGRVCGERSVTVLVDLGTRTVHPVSGIDAALAGIDRSGFLGFFGLRFARPDPG